MFFLRLLLIVDCTFFHIPLRITMRNHTALSRYFFNFLAHMLDIDQIEWAKRVKALSWSDLADLIKLLDFTAEFIWIVSKLIGFAS